jgi:hypothetical protein
LNVDIGGIPQDAGDAVMNIPKAGNSKNFDNSNSKITLGR